MKRIVAMTGLSGVGKTTFLTTLQAQIPFQHLQAGVLIKAAREMKTSAIVPHDHLRNLDLDNNQKLLVETFHHRRDKSALIILDGHTVIEREDDVSVIPATVFAALEIEAIFAFVDHPETIVARRVADLTRKRPQLSASEISRRQEIATEQAKAIAAALDISFRCISSGDAELCNRLLSSSDWSAGM